MPKKYSTTTTLLIVESPAKCKKIEEYLGPGYKCLASYGHLRTILSLKDIDIANNFKPTYTIIDNSIKKKQIEVLRKQIKSADEVIIASDSDREGEMIGFSIIELFKLPINTKRIVFNEITETALRNAMREPTTINMDIVHAQQARQILDILVGFNVSPMLWKFITRPKGNEFALSAGRCQTPALRLIYDNDEDIKNATERNIYNTTGYFTNSNIAFELRPQGKHETENEITDYLDGCCDFSHIYNCSSPVKVYKSPPEPLTTSRIQQVASNELHYAPKETMRICQLLYEGGFITYMRTDSKTYSAEFLNTVKTHIVSTYANGEKYISDDIENITSCVKNDNDKITENKRQKQKNIVCQEAHEAIRPTNISLCDLPESMNSKERRLYKIIWRTTLESCMTSASFYSVTANISSFQDMKFVYTSELIDFPGWKIVEKKYSTENKEFQYLQKIKQNSIIPYKKIVSIVSIKGTKQHYTESRLVQLLEQKGIGRPSTFSSLVDKIQERGYVKKEDIKGKTISCKDYELDNDEIYEIETNREFGNEKSKLVLQPLGRVVMEFLEKHFDDLFNYNYTSLMEDALDKIAKGQYEWHELCNKCNNEIDTCVDSLKNETKIEMKIDGNNTYIIGKYGPVIKSIEKIDGKEEIKFKPIKKNIDIKFLEKGCFTTEDIIDTNKTSKSQYILGQHNGKDVILRKGKFGLYISWGDNSKNLKEFGNRPIENITFDEVRKYLDEGSNMIREISFTTSIRKGPKGDYIFYKTSKMKKPEFKDIKSFASETKEDYKICDITILKSWLADKYNI
jgi:DNA topoisomerase-1